ncbi:type VII secretion protein EccB, partial [Cumulibacter manganitolerans]|uniref:type VII secretion protein EccB n=1 Tax=Cumulibacter manganitolerans TaxID=1884992 RepID=UPI0018860150
SAPPSGRRCWSRPGSTRCRCSSCWASSGALAGVADDAALRRLGYRPEAAIAAPAELFAVLHAGPELSVAAAMLPVGG